MKPSTLINHGFKLWDKIEKSFLVDENGFDLAFDDLQSAELYREKWFADGNYIDKPITVVDIIQYNSFGKLIRLWT